MNKDKWKISKERTIGLPLRTAKALFMSSSAKKQYRSEIRKRIFSAIMADQRWGEDSYSGWGSTKEVTTVTRDIICKVIDEFKIGSMFDVPCGDCSWMSLVLPNLPGKFKYIGGDIVDALIDLNRKKHPEYDFKTIDFVCDRLPKCDLIFCRDALQHLPIRDIKDALENFSNSGAQYLLTTTHLRRTGLKNFEPCRIGSCRDRNLLLKPFALPDPIAIFSEQSVIGKFLGLWKLPLRNP